MKTAADWFEEGIAALALSRSADYHSEHGEDLERALAAFEQALALEPTHAGALRHCGLTLAQLDRHERALACLCAAARLQPDDADLQLALGQSLARAARAEEALAAFGEALRLRPGDAEAMFGRAEALSALARHQAALAAWDAVLAAPELRTITSHGRTVRVLTGDMRRLQARLARAAAMAQLGRPDALAAFRAVIDEHAVSLAGPMAPAAFHAALRDHEVARAAYGQHAAARAGDPDTWRRAGNAWLAAGRTDEALAAFDEVVRLAPADARAWYGKAEVQAQREDTAGAIAAYEKALELWPGFLGAAARLRAVKDAAVAPRSWRVMGHDTFARHDYVVGDFPTKAEAEACADRREAAMEAHDAALRDTYWVEPTP